MADEIRTVRERLLEDGTLQKLQMRFPGPGKRPIPMGWNPKRPGVKISKSAASTAAKTTQTSSATPATDAKIQKKPRSASEEAPSSNLLAWVAGAVATAGVILGGLYVLSNRA